MRLWAPDHPRGCAICLLDGRMFCVPCDPAGIETPKAFLRAAVARGCVPVGTEPEGADPDAFRRATMIGEAARNAMTNARAPASRRGNPRPRAQRASILTPWRAQK